MSEATYGERALVQAIQLGSVPSDDVVVGGRIDLNLGAGHTGAIRSWGLVRQWRFINIRRDNFIGGYADLFKQCGAARRAASQDKVRGQSRHHEAHISLESIGDTAFA